MKLMDLRAAFLTVMFVGIYGSVILLFVKSIAEGLIALLCTTVACTALYKAIEFAERNTGEEE